MDTYICICMYIGIYTYICRYVKTLMDVGINVTVLNTEKQAAVCECLSVYTRIQSKQVDPSTIGKPEYTYSKHTHALLGSQ